MMHKIGCKGSENIGDMQEKSRKNAIFRQKSKEIASQIPTKSPKDGLGMYAKGTTCSMTSSVIDIERMVSAVRNKRYPAWNCGKETKTTIRMGYVRIGRVTGGAASFYPPRCGGYIEYDGRDTGTLSTNAERVPAKR